MRNVVIPCAVLMLLSSVASIAGRHTETMDVGMTPMERFLSEEVTKLKQAVSVITEELAQTKREFKEFQEANKNDDDVSNTEMARRQINLNAVLDDERREQLSNLLSNSGISIDELATLLKGKDGMPGETGEPGPVGPPGHCSKYDCQGPPPYRTYWSQENADSYIRVTNLPALSELTACFYFEPSRINPLDILGSNSLNRNQHLFSIASPNNYNAFNIQLYKENGVHPYMNLAGDPQKFTAGLGAFGEVHRHCFVWKAGSTLKWFYDVKQPGTLKLVGTIPSTGTHDIRSGSALVPLHDQDGVGGALDINQMGPGKIADFQMWDRALSDQEVQALGCDEKGSLVTFDDFDTVGLGKFHQGGNFQCTTSD